MTTPRRQVLVVGWDAADWKVIRPLVAAGEMPHLARLLEGGAAGNLATIRPVFSPMVWTSIATGKRPFKHGVLGFTERDPISGGARPVTSLGRTTKALWNITTQVGLDALVVGWWPTQPAEQIRGVMVSDAFQKIAGRADAPWPVPAGAVHPPALIARLAELRVHPEEMDEWALGPFVPRLAEVDQESDHRLESIARILSECTTVQAVATALLANEPWDLACVYFDAIDHFCHGFMRYHPPRMQNVSERDHELYKDVVNGGYRYHDMLLGTLLRLAGEDTTVVIVSDHGFHSDHLRPVQRSVDPAGPADEHRDIGIVVLHGPGVRKGVTLEGASVLDIAPTVLHLLGLAVGDDMDGRVLAAALAEERPVEHIPSWDLVPGECGMHDPDARIDPGEGSATLDQLVALGYVDAPDANLERASRDAAREQTYNLARAYMDGNRHRDALPLFEALWEEFPAEHRFGVATVRCRAALRDASGARAAFGLLVARKHEDMERAREELREFHEEHRDTPAADVAEHDRRRYRRLRARMGHSRSGLALLEAHVALAERKPETALALLRAVEQIDPTSPLVHLSLGATYLRMRRPEHAEAAFRRVLAADPEHAGALIGLARALLRRRQWSAAADVALSAAALRHQDVQPHLLLGAALQRLRRPRDAVSALRTAVALNPQRARAHTRLMLLHNELFEPELALRHKRLAEQARALAPPAPPRASGAVEPDGEDDVAAAAPRPLEGGPPPADRGAYTVVVSGLPRSGTSLVMQMLVAGGLPAWTDGARTPDEDNPRGYFEHAAVRGIAREARWLGETPGHAVKIVAPLLGYVPADAPVRVVFVERDVDEVAASQRAMLARHGARGGGESQLRLARQLRRQLRGALARLAARETPTCIVRHRDCIADPDAVARRIAAFVGGPLDAAAMARVVDPRLHRQHAPDAAAT